MTHPRLSGALHDLGVNDFAEEAQQRSIVRRIAERTVGDLEQANIQKLPSLAVVYEIQGINSCKDSLRAPDEDQLSANARLAFERAYGCWEALTTVSGDDGPNADQPLSRAISAAVNSAFPGSELDYETQLAFHLACTGLLSGNTTEARLHLMRLQIGAVDPETWNQRVNEMVTRAFILLVRKRNGWSDIDEALVLIERLRETQGEFERDYLEAWGDRERQALAAAELVGFYHLAQIITLTGTYLQEGRLAIAQLNIQLDRHRDRALAAFQATSQNTTQHLAEMLWAGCRELSQNSIWNHMSSLGQDARRFAAMLADRGRVNPVIDLWPSQQAALKQNFLDPYRRAILVEMPTSAGKTLLAKFAIVQTRALNPDSTIAYVVPTRALVNQITQDLRADFGQFGLSVEQAVPSFELNPTESALLAGQPDILVVTPEKLDLLIKGNHAATQRLSLVIADEAHSLADGTRGARLELLLGTIKREKQDARFLLLSPFVPSAEDLVNWLGDDRALPPIRVDWKPGRKVVGTISVKGRGQARATCFSTVPATSNVDVATEFDVPIAPPASSNSIAGLTESAVSGLIQQGSVLVLCRGRGTAATRAAQLCEGLPPAEDSKLLDAVCNFVSAEAGFESSLTNCLRRSVAYHHSGLSHETRWLIERLIASGVVKVVCGTTTLAQGMNFPIRTVIVETLKKGTAPLEYEDFWNIAGRAGRALVDPVGIVGYPTPTAAKRREFTEFLQGEAAAISSQLATLLNSVDEIVERFDLAAVRRWPALAEMMRFLAHAMRVAGDRDVADEVEELLRASLVYYQVGRESQDSANELVRLCRSYLNSLEGRAPNLLSLADKTGFATPSVLALLARSLDEGYLRDPAGWDPHRLFGPDTTELTARVEAIADLPEMQLSDFRGGQLNAERIAQILRDWVGGISLDELANRYDRTGSADRDERLTTFSQYLFSTLVGQASWGIGALEGVCLSGTPEEETADAGFVPSMIFYGVNTKEAVWLRMAGVPRVVANELAAQWGDDAGVPTSYSDIRRWVSDLTDDQWQAALPQGQNLSANDMRLVWKQLN